MEDGQTRHDAHYLGLLLSYFTSSYLEDFDAAILVINQVITKEMNEMLNMKPNGEQIKEALFHMHPTKALGPDGLYALLASFKSSGILLNLRPLVL